MPFSNPADADIEFDHVAPSLEHPRGAPRWEAAEPLLSQSDNPAYLAELETRLELQSTGSTVTRLFSFLPRFQRFLGTRSSSRSTAGRLLSKLKVDSEPGLTNAQLFLTNHDLKPVEVTRQTWGNWSFVAFWIADSFNVSTWMIGASLITQNGLAWWQAWLCIWIGYSLAAIFVCLTGRIGATYHISFPVVARASFGIWGSLWPVLNRAVMACIWYGVQAWIGGNCIVLMIRAISPGFNDLHNTMEGQGTNTRDFVGFMIFWVISLPAIWFPVHTIRHLFTLKAIFVPLAGLAFFIWSITRARGIGPIVRQPAKAGGRQLFWGFISGFMSSLANFATLIVNDPDFSRFAKHPRNAFLPQLLTIPISFAFTSFIGIIVSSSSKVIYGTTIWNPLDLLSQFLLDNPSPAQRVGVFIISSAFALAQLGTNIAANSVSAGTDFTALLPKYLTIRRGSYLCAMVGLIICPWHLLNSSNNFLTYLSSYSVFLSSIAGVVVCDYYLVRKGRLLVQDLYSAKKEGVYFYHAGVSWRAYIAYGSGVVVNLPGYFYSLGVKVPALATYSYRLNFFSGFLTSMAIYYILCGIWPIPAMGGVWFERDEDEDREYSGLSGLDGDIGGDGVVDSFDMEDYLEAENGDGKGEEDKDEDGKGPTH